MTRSCLCRDCGRRVNNAALPTVKLYCKRCGLERKRRRNREYAARQRKKHRAAHPLVTVIKCEACGVAVSVSKSGRRFCSTCKKHRGREAGARHREKKREAWRKANPDAGRYGWFHCVQCEGEFPKETPSQRRCDACLSFRPAKSEFCQVPDSAVREPKGLAKDMDPRAASLLRNRLQRRIASYLLTAKGVGPKTIRRRDLGLPCPVCGVRVPKKPQVAHITSVGVGGACLVGNVIVVCARCNPKDSRPYPPAIQQRMLEEVAARNAAAGFRPDVRYAGARRKAGQARVVKPSRPGLKPEELFREYVEEIVGDGPPPPGGWCWRWKGTKNAYGRPLLRVNGRHVAAYRFSYEMRNGPIPEGLLVRHLCVSEGECTNPNHLALGTAKDNALDRISMGTNRSGSAQSGARFTDAQITEILCEYMRGVSSTRLGVAYGVAEPVILRILKGRSYRDVERPPGFRLRASGRQPSYSRSQYEAVLTQLGTGKRMREIAAETGVKISDVRNIKYLGCKFYEKDKDT